MMMMMLPSNETQLASSTNDAVCNANCFSSMEDMNNTTKSTSSYTNNNNINLMKMMIPTNRKTQKTKKTKHVTFYSQVVMIQVSSYKPYKEQLWYDKVSLDKFRYQSHYESHLIRSITTAETQKLQQMQHGGIGSMDFPVMPTLALNDSSRGCEQRSCSERQRRKFLSLQFILRAAKRLQQQDQQQQQMTQMTGNDAANPSSTATTTDTNSSSSIKLAHVAERCNEWAVRLAAEEGIRDYYRAYNDTNNSTNTSTCTTRSSTIGQIRPSALSYNSSKTDSHVLYDKKRHATCNLPATTSTTSTSAGSNTNESNYYCQHRPTKSSRSSSPTVTDVSMMMMTMDRHEKMN